MEGLEAGGLQNLGLHFLRHEEGPHARPVGLDGDRYVREATVGEADDRATSRARGETAKDVAVSFVGD
jgi:hypothetical protein